MTGLPSEAVWPFLAFGIGLILGSFANVCIHRIPLRESVVHPSSRCPGCGAPIRPWDNVPIASFLLLRGRCRRCRASISWRYPLVEGTNGALYLLAARTWGPSPQAGFLMLLITSLLVLSLIDLDHQILPNVITIPGTAVGVAASLTGISGVDLRSSLLGAIGGYVAFWAVARAYKNARRAEGLGEGDWKMAAMLGACLGGKGLILTVLIASVAGTLVGLALMAFRGRSAQHPLPFGTFLGLSGILVAFVGDPLFAWYSGLFRV
jgi:leader peptidase (prepilin peptidase)/N-methyltransferase